MILLGAVIWILSEHLQAREGELASAVLHTAGVKGIVVGLNLSVAALVLWLHVSGVITGVTRAGFSPGETYVPPTWLANWNGVLFAATGVVALLFFVLLLARLVPVAVSDWWVAPTGPPAGRY